MKARIGETYERYEDREENRNSKLRKLSGVTGQGKERLADSIKPFDVCNPH